MHTCAWGCSRAQSSQWFGLHFPLGSGKVNKRSLFTAAVPWPHAKLWDDGHTHQQRRMLQGEEGRDPFACGTSLFPQGRSHGDAFGRWWALTRVLPNILHFWSWDPHTSSSSLSSSLPLQLLLPQIFFFRIIHISKNSRRDFNEDCSGISPLRPLIEAEQKSHNAFSGFPNHLPAVQQ